MGNYPLLRGASEGWISSNGNLFTNLPVCRAEALPFSGTFGQSRELNQRL